MADSSKDIQLRELKDMITDLKKMIKTLQATVNAANKREEALTQERDNLKDEVALLRKKLFGSSSEKRTLDIPGQLNLFNEAEMEQDPAAAKAEELEASLPDKAGKKRKARATDAERFKGIPVQKKYLDLADGEKACPVCNTALEEIGEEFVRRELVFIPAKLKVYEYYSKNYTCPECSKRDLPVIKKGKDGKPHMLYGMASAGTVAWVMYQKFCNGLPYCRQEKDWKQYGAAITRATMANWVIHNSEAFFFQCMGTFTGNFWKGDLQWQMKRPCRYSMNRDAAHRQNLTCGFSAVVKTAANQSSSINTRRPVQGTMRWISFMDLKAI